MRHALWSLYVPSQTVGASVTLFDLYNGSDRDITVSSIVAVRDASVAATGLVSVQMFLTRTSAIGTGGTEAASGGTGLAAATISNVQQSALPTGITARLTPTAGGTAGAVICERHIIPEETLVQPAVEFLDALLTVPEGTGIRVVQGTVASVGKVGFTCLFY